MNNTNKIDDNYINHNLGIRKNYLHNIESHVEDKIEHKIITKLSDIDKSIKKSFINNKDKGLVLKK